MAGDDIVWQSLFNQRFKGMNVPSAAFDSFVFFFFFDRTIDHWMPNMAVGI